MYLALEGRWRLFFCPEVVKSHPSFLTMENHMVLVFFRKQEGFGLSSPTKMQSSKQEGSLNNHVSTQKTITLVSTLLILAMELHNKNVFLSCITSKTLSEIAANLFQLGWADERWGVCTTCSSCLDSPVPCSSFSAVEVWERQARGYRDAGEAPERGGDLEVM